MPSTVVVSDASVAFKWFHEAGEEGVGPARALLDAYTEDRIDLVVLDLTRYEIGNALLRGRTRADAATAEAVLTALAEICPSVVLDAAQLRLAADIAHEHGLTFYDAAYAAVARSSDGLLATVDEAVIAAGLGHPPSEILSLIGT